MKWNDQRQTGPHLGMLVGAVIIEDDVDGFACRNVSFDLVVEPDGLLMLVFWPVTDPSSTLSAAKSVVVPLRL